ncbi:hypothetical protein OY671_008921, partial [Metschnikowia pulcherrima]
GRYWAASRWREQGMDIQRLDHVQSAMPPGGEDRARAFYRDVSGIREVPKPPHSAKSGGCWFERAAVKVHLGVDPDFRPVHKAHVAFIVAHLGDSVRKSEHAGCYVIRDEASRDGYQHAYVDDPFGNRSESMELSARLR